MLIRVPHRNDKPPRVFEELLMNLHGLLHRRKVSLELASLNQHIYFFIRTPEDMYHLIEGQVYAQYLDAEIDVVQDYAQNVTGLALAGSDIRLKRSDLYPFKTYAAFEGDSMAGIFSLFTRATQNEEVWMQIVMEPGDEEGKLTLRRIWRVKFRNFFNKFNPAKFFRTKSRSATLKAEREAIALKAEKDSFHTTVRIAYLAPDPATARQKLASLGKAFTFFDTTDFNSLEAGRFVTHTGFIKDYRFARMNGRGQIMNVEEVATLYHFPPASTPVPNLVITLSRKAEPPQELPKEANTNADEVSIFGETNFHNQHMRFGIKRTDRQRHLYICGKSGTGKSKLLELLIREDMLAGKGVGVIDPHGDLIDSVIRQVPKERIDDVVFFDPTDMEYPIAFNPIEKVGKEYYQHIAQGFIEIFRKLFGSNWTSRVEHVLRYTVLALLDYPQSTTLGILKMLSDKNYRQRVISYIDDPTVKSYWVNEFAAWSEKYDNEAIVPVLNKVGQFVSTSLVRNIVGQPLNKVNLGDIMNNGKILLAKISKGHLGEENAQLLGSMLLTKIQQYALMRAAQEEQARRDFYLYVDEFQYFATRTFAEIFSEARKYKLNLTVSNQYLGQLTEEMRATAFGNVGSIISFRVGAEDAYHLEREFTPVFSQRDIINLGIRECYVKMSVDGQIYDAFSARTVNVPVPQEHYEREIIDHSREKYCIPRGEVEQLIADMDKEESAEFEGGAEGGEDKFSAPIV